MHLDRASTVRRNPPQAAVISSLVLQQSAFALLTHYSRTIPSTHRYLPSTAILLAEIIKLAVSLTFSLWEVSRTLAPSTPATTIFEQIYRAVFAQNAWKFVFPTLLYTAHNFLQYVALGNLDPVHYQVLYEVKMIIAAVFGAVLLRRSITLRRFLALAALAVGATLVAAPLHASPQGAALLFQKTSDHWFPRSVHELGQLANGAGSASRELTRRSATYEGIIDDDLDLPVLMNPSIGILAVLTAAVLAGLAAVSLEQVVRESPSHTSVWTRNIQLSLFSLIPVFFLGILYNDGQTIIKNGFFSGYNALVWSVIVLHAAGGLLLSFTLGQPDSPSPSQKFTISTAPATAATLLLTFILSISFLDLRPTKMLVGGSALVLVATWAYHAGETPARRPPPIRVASLEKMIVDRLQTPTIGGNLTVNPMDLAGAALSTSRPASPMVGRRGFEEHGGD